MNLLLLLKGYRQFQSTREWYKPGSLFADLVDYADEVQDRVVYSVKQAWLSPVKAFWHFLLWIMGEKMEDYWTLCSVMTYWMVNATLLLLIWRTSFTVVFAIVTTFLVLLKFIGYLRGFENCGWLLSVLNQVRSLFLDIAFDNLVSLINRWFVDVPGLQRLFGRYLYNTTGLFGDVSYPCRSIQR